MQAVPSLSSSDSLKCFLHAIVTALVIVFGVIAISGVIIVVFVVPSLPSCDSPSIQFAAHDNVIVVVTALFLFLALLLYLALLLLSLLLLCRVCHPILWLTVCALCTDGSYSLVAFIRCNSHSELFPDKRWTQVSFYVYFRASKMYYSDCNCTFNILTF